MVHHSEQSSANVVIVDPDRLESETLARLAREFLLRESHDDLNQGPDLSSEIAKVIYRLKSRECLICFDPETESVGVVLAKDFHSASSRQPNADSSS